MGKIEPAETVIAGRWITDNVGGVVGDSTCQRIEMLIHSHLRKLSHDTSGWHVLYQDPDDGRYRELHYPQSEVHGGGPPEIRCITTREVAQNMGSLPWVDGDNLEIKGHSS